MRAIVILVVVLIAWMIGGTYFWTCNVKAYCGPDAEELAAYDAINPTAGNELAATEAESSSNDASADGDVAGSESTAQFNQLVFDDGNSSGAVSEVVVDHQPTNASVEVAVADDVEAASPAVDEGTQQAETADHDAESGNSNQMLDMQADPGDIEAGSESASTAVTAAQAAPDEVSGGIRLLGPGWDGAESNSTLAFVRGTPTLTRAEALRNVADTIAPGLNASDKRSLMVVGGFARDEADGNSDGPNLGMRRAQAVGDALVAAGIPADRLMLSFAVADTTEALSDSLLALQTVGFDAVTASVSTAESAGADENSSGDWALPFEDKSNPPLVIQFEFGKDWVQLDDQKRSQIAAVINYMNKDRYATLRFVGHTDNVGVATSNLALGLRRARKVSEYFQQFGLRNSSTELNSKGDRQPRASNATAEGRAENRRVEVSIQR